MPKGQKLKKFRGGGRQPAEPVVPESKATVLVVPRSTQPDGEKSPSPSFPQNPPQAPDTSAVAVDDVQPLSGTDEAPPAQQGAADHAPADTPAHQDHNPETAGDVKHNVSGAAAEPEPEKQDEDHALFSSARSSTAEPAIADVVPLGDLNSALETLVANLHNVGATDTELREALQPVATALFGGLVEATSRVEALIEEEKILYGAEYAELKKLETCLNDDGRVRYSSPERVPPLDPQVDEDSVCDAPEAKGADPTKEEHELPVPLMLSHPFITAVRAWISGGGSASTAEVSAAAKKDQSASAPELPKCTASARAYRQQLVQRREHLHAQTQRHIEHLAACADKWHEALAALQETRAAIEKDARVHDDILGRKSTDAALTLPANVTPEELVETAELDGAVVRSAGLQQNLSRERIDRLAMATLRVQERVRDASEFRASQQSAIVFDRLWGRVRDAAENLRRTAPGCDSREVHSRTDATSQLDAVIEARKSKLHSRLTAAAASPGDVSFVVDSAPCDQVPDDTPDSVRALFAPSSATCAAKLEAVRAEERFALDRVLLFKSGQLGIAEGEFVEMQQAYVGMTGDTTNYGMPPGWSTDVPARYAAVAASRDQTGASDAATEEQRPSASALTARAVFDYFAASALADVSTPAAQILAEIEEVNAVIDDSNTATAVLRAKVQTATDLIAPFRRRQALLEEAKRYDAVSARDRLMSRKPNQAQEMMREARVRQQMRDALPGFEKHITEALAAFDEAHPKAQDVFGPITIDGVVLRDQTFGALAAAEAAAASRATSRQRSVVRSVAVPVTPSRIGSVTPCRGVSATPVVAAEAPRPRGTFTTTHTRNTGAPVAPQTPRRRPGLTPASPATQNVAATSKRSRSDVAPAHAASRVGRTPRPATPPQMATGRSPPPRMRM